MATAITPTVGNGTYDNNTFEGKGRKSVSQAYEATSIPLFAYGAAVQYFCYAQLTGAMTINAATTIARLSQFDEVVTFGTGFKSSGTVTIPADKGAVVRGIFDGTSIRITSREIYA
jgi:hypothetical protein